MTISVTPRVYAACCSSVAFIPGIQATELYEGDSKRWLPDDFFDADVVRLKLDSLGQSVNEITVGNPVRDATYFGRKFLEVYGEFFNFLDVLKGANVIAGWTALPYDWRNDVYDVALQDQHLYDGSFLNLADEVRVLAAASDTGKVTIVTHSNGGLVGKALIDALGADAALVDRFVMVGSPQLGTPSAIAALANGQEQGLPKDYAPFIMSRSAARSLAENMPGAYGLLPLGRYSTVVSSPMVEFDTSPFTVSFRNAYGVTIDTPAELQSFLQGIGDGRAKPTPEDLLTPNVLNSTLLADAQLTRNAQEAWIAPSEIEVVQIVGWGLDTMKAIRYSQRCDPLLGCFMDAKPVTTTEGDKTVVFSSAAALEGADTYFFNMYAFNQANSINLAHVNMTAAADVKDLLHDIITNAARGAQFITTTKPLVSDGGSRIHLSVHSPVTLRVLDPQGRFTGVISNPDPLVSVPVVVQEIPNSYYYEFGEGKYVGLDANQQYEVVMRGTDDGIFTLEIEEVRGDTVTATTTYSNVPVSTTTRAELRIQDIGDKSALEIDEDGDGVLDEIIEPDSSEKTPHQKLEAFRAATNALNVHTSIKKHLIARSYAVEKTLEKNKKHSIRRAKSILTRMEAYIRNRTDKRRGIPPADAQVLIGMLRTIGEGI